MSGTARQNSSNTDAVHLLQIWILPNARNLKPGYETKSFSDDEKQGRLRLVAANDGCVTAQSPSIKMRRFMRPYWSQAGK